MLKTGDEAKTDSFGDRSHSVRAVLHRNNDPAHYMRSRCQNQSFSTASFRRALKPAPEK